MGRRWGKEHAAWPLKGRTSALAFDSRGERLAAREGIPLGSSGEQLKPETLHVWNLATRREALSVPLAPSNVVTVGTSPLAFTPHGREIVVGQGLAALGTSASSSWSVRSAETGAERLAIEGAEAYLHPIVSPDGRWLISCGLKRVSVWDFRSGKEVQLRISLASEASPAISPDGKSLAVIRGPEVPLFDFEPIVAPGRNEPQIFEEVELPPARHLRGAESALQAIAFTPDGSQLVTIDGTGILHEWDLTMSERVWLKGFDKLSTKGSTFSGDSQRLAGRAYNTVRSNSTVSGFNIETLWLNDAVGIWDTTGQALLQRPVSMRDAAVLDLSHDGRRLAFKSFPESSPYSGGASGVAGLAVLDLGTAVNGPGRLIVATRRARLVSAPSPVHLIDVDADRELFTLPPEATPVQFSPDSRLLAGGNIGILDWQTPVDLPRFVSAIQKLPPRDTDWHVWDAATGRRVISQRPKPGSYVAVAFRPDGRRLAVWKARGPESGELTLWDLDAGRSLFSEPWPLQPLSFPDRLQFSPDGQRLVAVGWEWDEASTSKHLTLWEVRDDGAKVLVENPSLPAKVYPQGERI